MILTTCQLPEELLLDYTVSKCPWNHVLGRADPFWAGCAVTEKLRVLGPALCPLCPYGNIGQESCIAGGPHIIIGIASSFCC